jgi:hypothetical protein
MKSQSPWFVDIINRALGCSEPSAVAAILNRPWAGRGIANAMSRLGITSTDETEISAIWALSFEAGALSSLRLARGVLSDPQVRGRELEALKLVEDGLDHAAILAALRKAAAAEVPIGNATVVAFPNNRSRSDRPRGSGGA